MPERILAGQLAWSRGVDCEQAGRADGAPDELAAAARTDPCRTFTARSRHQVHSYVQISTSGMPGRGPGRSIRNSAAALAHDQYRQAAASASGATSRSPGWLPRWLPGTASLSGIIASGPPSLGTLADCIIALSPVSGLARYHRGGPEHRPGYRPGDFTGTTSIPERDAETWRLNPLEEQ